MNKFILNTGIQNFIKENLNTDTVSVLLKKPIFEGVTQKELAQQLESRKKAEHKLPSWFSTGDIYYPPKLHIEQTSSERTAEYKSRLVDGKKLIDLTGGLGVDSFYFSKKMESVWHCETNLELSKIAAHNLKQLSANNIEFYTGDGIDFIQNSNLSFDWIYIDPSRRNDAKEKIFLLKDCKPNVPELLAILFTHSHRILIKASPILDITQAQNELKCIREIHCVAVANEVKEVLFVLESGYEGEVTFKGINLSGESEVEFDFTSEEEITSPLNLGMPEIYLYEPNASILKLGAFKTTGNRFGLKKLHRHSHLYTSEQLVEFPGRRFRIQSCQPYSKKVLKSLKGAKANISTRNFPVSVVELRKKNKIKDGGDTYIFFTTTSDDKKMVIICSKTS